MSRQHLRYGTPRPIPQPAPIKPMPWALRILIALGPIAALLGIIIHGGIQ